MVDYPALTYYGPMYGPDHKNGPTVGPHVRAWKRMLWRWDPDVFPGPALQFDDVFNRRIQDATRIAQRFWKITASGNVGKATFERGLKALRGRGLYKPLESAWDATAINLYRKAAPRVPPARCFIYPAGAEIRIISSRTDHMRRPLGNWQSDNAVDFWAKPGTPILAPKAGFVSRIGGKDPHLGVVGTIFGEHLTIDCPDGDRFFFTHTKRLTSLSENVVAGEVLGLVADWPHSDLMDHAHMGRIWKRDPHEVTSWPKVKPFT